MGFITRWDFHPGQPIILSGRVYLHNTGFGEVFRQDKSEEGGVLDAKSYANGVRTDLLGMRDIGGFSHREISWVIMAIWGDVKASEPVADIVTFTDLEEVWPGNPSIDAFVLRSGRRGLKRGSVCEDTALVLGQEALYRRLMTRDLKDYLRNPPPMNLPGPGIWTAFAGAINNIEGADPHKL